MISSGFQKVWIYVPETRVQQSSHTDRIEMLSRISALPPAFLRVPRGRVLEKNPHTIVAFLACSPPPSKGLCETNPFKAFDCSMPRAGGRSKVKIWVAGGGGGPFCRLYIPPRQTQLGQVRAGTAA